MDKETLSNYGWIVICVLVIAVMLALASPFGTYIAEGFNSAKQGFFDTGDSALDVGLSAVGVSNKLPCGHKRNASGDHSQKECGHYACNDCGCVPAACGVEGHWSGDGLDHTTWVGHSTGNLGFHRYKCECVHWTVPEGGTYTQGSTVYNEGEQLPCGTLPYTGAIYTEGNYEYRYNQEYSFSGWGNSYTNGWGVHCVNNVADPGPIRSSINGQPVNNMEYTFYNCSNMITAPEIPSTVAYITDMFYGCTALKTYHGSTEADGCFYNYKLPENIGNMDYVFYNCTNIVVAPKIPNSVTSMNSTFSECSNLTTAPLLPSDVTNLYKLYRNCANLKTYHGSTDPDGDFSNYTLPSSAENMYGVFKCCKSIVIAPKMTNVTNVTTIDNMFRDCTSLTTAPEIPSSVTSMWCTFRGCTSLTTAPTIPSSVTDMNNTFDGCTSLTGTITINANPTTYTNCFRNVDMSKITLTGEASKDVLNLLGGTGKNWTPIE